MRKSDMAIDEQTMPIGPAMTEHVTPASQTIDVYGLMRIEMNDAGKTAHMIFV